MADLPRASYDGSADVFYIKLKDGPAVSREEDAPGVYWRYDIDDRQTLVGITIIDFEAYWAEHTDELIRAIAAKMKLSNKRAARLLEAA